MDRLQPLDEVVEVGDRAPSATVGRRPTDVVGDGAADAERGRRGRRGRVRRLVDGATALGAAHAGDAAAAITVRTASVRSRRAMGPPAGVGRRILRARTICRGRDARPRLPGSPRRGRSPRRSRCRTARTSATGRSRLASSATSARVNAGLTVRTTPRPRSVRTTRTERPSAGFGMRRASPRPSIAPAGRSDSVDSGIPSIAASSDGVRGPASSMRL